MRNDIRNILYEYINKIEEQKTKRLGSKDFISNAKEIYGDKYDYSKVDYINNKTPITITCPIHGEFNQFPYNHILRGCPKCGLKNMKDKKTKNLDNFIKDSIKIHGDKYDYSKVNYEGSNTPVEIICSRHGEFLQTPSNHLIGSGCQKCANENQSKQKKLTNNDFIKKSHEIHGDKYDYSKVNYLHSHQKVEIICPKHGMFQQNASSHMKGSGCPICSESKGEKLVRDILLRKNISSIPQHQFNDCTNEIKGRHCRKLTFDFYLPKYNACIEYDGQQHFEPIVGWGGNGEENFVKRLKLDKIRDQYCKQNRINLIRIPYTMNKEEIEPYILKKLEYEY